VNKCLST